MLHYVTYATDVHMLLWRLLRNTLKQRKMTNPPTTRLTLFITGDSSVHRYLLTKLLLLSHFTSSFFFIVADPKMAAQSSISLLANSLPPQMISDLGFTQRNGDRRRRVAMFYASDHQMATYHANRMLSFYAPGWCGEIRDVIFSDNGSVTVVFRVTIRGSDGEAHRESTGTVSSSDTSIEDPVAAAEEIAFCRACARFGLGLYLYQK
ncbi:hypothetical protein QQ045_017355 [Rhodiola kirilowii]